MLCGLVVTLLVARCSSSSETGNAIAFGASYSGPYFPIDIINQTNQSDSTLQTYFLVASQNFGTPALWQVLTWTYDAKEKAYRGSTVLLDGTTTAAAYSHRLDSMKLHDASKGTVRLLVPQMQSARVHVSLQAPLCMATTPDSLGNYSFVEPNVNSPVDPNVNLVFDKFEFTFNQSNQMFMNPTSVDFFSLPLIMTNGTDTSGALLTQNRDDLMGSLVNSLTQAGGTWDSCIFMDKVNGTVIRINAPQNAIGFDKDYLTHSSNNYLTQLMNAYASTSGKVLYVDCSELNSTGFQIYDSIQKTPAQDPGAYYFKGQVDTATGIWSFTNDPDTPQHAFTIDLAIGSATSNDFFGPGNGAFATPNKTVQSILVESITSAFTVGFMPTGGANDTLSKAFFKGKMADYYTKNPTGFTGGPWYDLYAKYIHQYMGERTYAFAFDDVLSQDGTLQVSGTATPITVTLGDAGVGSFQTSCQFPVNAPTLTSVAPLGYDSTSDTAWFKAIIAPPPGQPANARYYLVPASTGVGADGLIQNANQIIMLQAQEGLAAGDTISVCVPGSWLNSPTQGATDFTVKVAACGSITQPCPTATSASNQTKNQATVPLAPSGTAATTKPCSY